MKLEEETKNGTDTGETVVKTEKEIEDSKADVKVDIKAETKRELGDSDDESPADRKKIKQEARVSRHCPYLDTINRGVLDFDFEKLCSISLSRINVYACLVCGKYFQGRGNNTHAYTHSVSEGHRVFLNLESQRFYCLPDNYEVIDASLGDILYVLNPTFSSDLIKRLETSTKESRAFDGSMYTPGVVGLNNIKANDYCNVILHALSHVEGLRNYFLDENNYKNIKRPPGDISFLLVQRYGELIRKLWNPKNFKAHVSPHEMLQSIVLCSKKKFEITKQGDAGAVLPWFLNSLHMALGGTKKRSSSIIYKQFLGSMRIHTKKIMPTDVDPKRQRELQASGEYDWKERFYFLTVYLNFEDIFTGFTYKFCI